MAEVEEKESDVKENEDKQEAKETDEEISPEGEDSESEGGNSPAKSKKKLIAAVVLVTLLSGGAIIYTLMHKKAEEEKLAAASQDKQDNNELIFHDMDEMIINLNTEGKGVSFMKLRITLELENKETLNQVKNLMPKISDVFQMYLRELRPSDMNGSVGLYRLKEELLLRINKIIYPSKVNDILFKEVLIQ